MSQVKIQWCPILYPTMKQFKSFHEYAQKLNNLYSHRYGMVKVVPPSEWKPRKTSYDLALQNLTVNGPIQQNLFGKAGIYECLLIQKKSLSLREYQLKNSIFDKICEGLSPQQIEDLFWKNVAYSPPLYGADLLNTLMDEQAGSWNMNNLESVLSYALQDKLKGVNTPYCYIGSWKTLFCWHKQDLDLNAINYLHKGKSKFWYSIPRNQQDILQKFAKKHFPQHFSKCHQFLRHKTSLINPYLLKKQHPNLQISKMQHKQNQFMLVFNGAYHSGFNFGCNIAQAVNYATTDWLRCIMSANSCKCSKNNVKASYIQIYKNLQKSPFNKSEAFLQFQRDLFKQIDVDQTEQRQKQVKGVKSVFTKKIKKNNKVKKIQYNGQQYFIDQWAQCDNCQIWRKVKIAINQKQRFICKNINKKCNQKQKNKSKGSMKYITL